MRNTAEHVAAAIDRAIAAIGRTAAWCCLYVVLAEFGVSLPPTVDIRVWDSTAETRFLVLPVRPTGTDGWSEERLARLVTRDAMIGTGLAKHPDDVA